VRSALAYSGVVVGLAVIALVSTATASAPEAMPPPLPREQGNREALPSSRSGAVTPHCRSSREAVPFYRQNTWEVQARYLDDLADRTPIVRGKSCHWARYAADEWVARFKNALRGHTRHLQALRSQSHRLYEKWRCIHEHEGAWNANTGNGYYGGLQMDWSFMRAYGPEFLTRWGTADRWPVWAQLQVAERAYAVRGFGPWPNTARMCGLL
jgi:Transglycosylase-like domain